MNCDEYCANHGCNRGPNCPAGVCPPCNQNCNQGRTCPANTAIIDIEVPYWVVGLAAIVIVGLAAFCSGVIVDHWGGAMITEYDLYAMGMESPTAWHKMKELCEALGFPYPPQAPKKDENQA